MRATVLILLALAGVGAAGSAGAQDFVLRRGLVSGGAVAATDGNFGLTATVAQPVVGLQVEPQYLIGWGFWFRAGLAATAVADQQVVMEAPGSLRLNVHPNPFNPRTTISFRVERSGTVNLEVHDLAGRRVRQLWRGVLPAGGQSLTWDGTDDVGRPVGSGVFLARLTIGSVSASRRLTMGSESRAAANVALAGAVDQYDWRIGQGDRLPDAARRTAGRSPGQFRRFERYNLAELKVVSGIQPENPSGERLDFRSIMKQEGAVGMYDNHTFEVWILTSRSDAVLVRNRRHLLCAGAPL